MEQLTKHGTIIFLTTHDGSKSECALPYLYCGKAEPLVPLYMENDNPFENNALTPFDGRRVTVTGYVGRNNDFIVTQVNAI